MGADDWLLFWVASKVGFNGLFFCFQTGAAMNYYPFHIGDFAAHTAHLSLEEDITYRRMLDWYYLNEKAMPADPAKVARLIRMPNSLAVVEAMLVEFFVYSEDGWHNKRADQELTNMLSKQEQQSTKDEHEAERMKRFRDRRASMFAALRVQNIVPAWDVPMKELQRLHDEVCNAPATHLQREQGVTSNANATAIPTPTPTPTPTPKKKTVDADPPEGVTPQTWKDWVALRKAKRTTASQTAVDGAKAEAAKAGMSLEDFFKVWCRRGSQGLEASWLKPDEKLNAGNQKPDPNWLAKPKWVTDAGFENVAEANNERCYERNAHQFQNGKRIEVLL